MRKSSALSFILPVLPLMAGIAGFFMRRFELATVFDPDTGLAVRDAPITFWLVALTIILLLILAAVSLYVSFRYKSPEGFDKSFGTRSFLYPLLFVPVIILWNCGTVLNLVNLRLAAPLQTIDYWFASISILAALSIVFFAVEVFQNPRSKFAQFLCIFPAGFLCFWLILLYRQNAANPVLLDFVYQSLALVFSTLGFYYTTGYFFDKHSPGKAIISYCGTIYFCTMILADNLGTGITLIFVSLVVIAMINLYLLTSNLQIKDSGENTLVEQKSENTQNTQPV